MPNGAGLSFIRSGEANRALYSWSITLSANSGDFQALPVSRPISRPALKTTPVGTPSTFARFAWGSW
jgi:hypothetical protein